jgi:hypothetical protein
MFQRRSCQVSPVLDRNIAERDHPCELALLAEDDQASHLQFGHAPCGLLDIIVFQAAFNTFRHYGGSWSQTVHSFCYDSHDNIAVSNEAGHHAVFDYGNGSNIISDIIRATASIVSFGLADTTGMVMNSLTFT